MDKFTDKLCDLIVKSRTHHQYSNMWTSRSIFHRDVYRGTNTKVTMEDNYADSIHYQNYNYLIISGEYDYPIWSV